VASTAAAEHVRRAEARSRTICVAVDDLDAAKVDDDACAISRRVIESIREIEAILADCKVAVEVAIGTALMAAASRRARPETLVAAQHKFNSRLDALREAASQSDLPFHWQL